MLTNTIHRLFLCLTLALIIAGCSTQTQEIGSGKLKIVCTTGMVADAVKNITGDSAEVAALMGPGVDPHLFKPSRAHLKALLNADVIISNGLHLEGKMAEILHKLARTKKVFFYSDGLDKSALIAIEPEEQIYDPHIWFDARLWASGVLPLADSLATLKPLAKSYLKANAQAYKSQILSLDSLAEKQIAIIPQQSRYLITSHDAFSYFGKRYGIQVMSLQGVSTISDFGLADVNHLVKLITEKRIKAIFTETGISHKSIMAVQSGCQAQGFKVEVAPSLYADALGNSKSAEGSYLGMFKYNVNTIVLNLAK